jgi:hypothetical protein
MANSFVHIELGTEDLEKSTSQRFFKNQSTFPCAFCALSEAGER